MRVWFVILSAAVAFSLLTAQVRKKKESGVEKVFKSLFTPRKPEPVKPPKRKKTTRKPAIKETPEEPKHKTFTVDAVWIARYIEMEQQWDYPIPEDDAIQTKDGKYFVPPVVFRHYEDMAATPSRASDNRDTAH